MAGQYKIYIIDDDPGMRESLGFLLESRGYAVETFVTAQAFLSSGVDQKTGCLIADVRLPGMTGLELQEYLATRLSALRIIFITGDADVPMAVKAMKAGAVDFVEKPFSDDALFASIERALSENHTPKHTVNAADASRHLALLTPREREILDYLVTGQPHKVIGHALSISPRTVEVHRARIMRKLGARNLTDLVRLTEHY